MKSHKAIKFIMECKVMNLRLLAGAFLAYENEVLLLHRGLHKEIAPGMWSCIGGHMESSEMNDPLSTCYREIEEETGITMSSIERLALRYIVTRNRGDEIYFCFYYFGKTTHRCKLHECSEGVLSWVRKEDIPSLPMSFSVKEMTNHWLSNQDIDNVLLCGINKENNTVSWVEL